MYRKAKCNDIESEIRLDVKIRALEKYDIRKFELKDNQIIKSTSFKKEEIGLMNLGIALNLAFNKLFNDKSDVD